MITTDKIHISSVFSFYIYVYFSFFIIFITHNL